MEGVEWTTWLGRKAESWTICGLVTIDMAMKLVSMVADDAGIHGCSSKKVDHLLEV